MPRIPSEFGVVKDLRMSESLRREAEEHLEAAILVVEAARRWLDVAVKATAPASLDEGYNAMYECMDAATECQAAIAAFDKLGERDEEGGGVRIVVTGGRNYANYEALFAALDRMQPVAIATGCAAGADALVRLWCIHRGRDCAMFAADWKKYGRSAGPRRNRAMLDEFMPDVVIAFKGGRGTEDCIRAAQDRGIPVLRVDEPTAPES